MKKLLSMFALCVCLGLSLSPISAEQQTVDGTGPDLEGETTGNVPTKGTVGEYDKGDPENPDIDEVSNLSMSIPKEMKFYVATNTNTKKYEIATPEYYFKNNGTVKVNGYLNSVAKDGDKNVLKLVDSVVASNGTKDSLPVAVKLAVKDGASINLQEDGFKEATIGLFALTEEKVLNFELNGTGVNAEDAAKITQFEGASPREVTGAWTFTYRFEKVD